MSSTQLSPSVLIKTSSPSDPGELGPFIPSSQPSPMAALLYTLSRTLVHEKEKDRSRPVPSIGAHGSLHCHSLTFDGGMKQRILQLERTSEICSETSSCFIRKLRPKEDQFLAHGHGAVSWQGWDWGCFQAPLHSCLTYTAVVLVRTNHHQNPP